MALQIHMPLVSDITNYGTSTIITQNSGAILTSSGAPIDSSTNFNGSYSFNNSNSYISLTGADLYNTIKGGSQPFTITMWVYHNDSTRAILFGDYGLSGAINFNVELTTSHTLRFYWNGSPDTAPSAASVGLKTWAYIGVVYNGSTIKFFVNGALKYTHTGTLTTLTKTSGSYYLGRDSRTGNTTLNGNLNDFRLYNEALTDSQIAFLYYTDTEVTPIIINKLTQSQYESITPDNTQLYLITDANLETTNHKVQTIDASSTNTQYPSATAVNDVKYRGEPFWIKPTANAYIMFSITGDASTIGTKPISYSFDKISWTDSTVGSLANGTTSINVLSNQKVYFKSTSTAAFHTNYVNIARLKVKTTSSSSSTDVNFVVGGKLISLFNDYAGNATYLLSESSVIDASELDVNDENTACVCDSLFDACANLTTPPVLSATILPNYAYANMFNNCASLNNAPALPAEELTSYCYTCMFAGCTNLRYAPPIMAKILANNCCEDMFLGCTSLETAPELLATTLAIDCYYEMFYNCSSLKQIPRLYSTTLAEECYYRMFGGCSSLELQSTSDGTHYNIFKIPEKPQYDWTLTWNNSMVTAPDGTVTLPDTLNTYQVEAYKLPSSTTFNGSSNYIDTGIKILDSDKSFTVMIDFAYGTSPGQYNTAIDCMISASPYNRGLCLYYNNTTPAIIPIYYTAAPSYTADQNRHKVIFRHNAGDAAVATLFYDSATGVALNGSSYTAVNKNVYLGCRLQDGGSRDRYFKGTMYDARIYLESLSDTNIADLINGNEPTEPFTPYYTIRGGTLENLVFSCNGINYDSIRIDTAGNMYYGASGTYTKVYDVTNGWVNSVYKTLSISNNPDDFENQFVNSGESINLYDPTTITTGYYINASGVKTTGPAASISDYIPVTPGHSYTWTGVAMESGTNNKRVAGYATTSTTTGTVINNVAVTGTNIPYENTFTVPTGLNYVRLSFNTVDTNIVLVDNDATGGSAWRTFKDTNLTISYAWDSRGLSITGMNFKSNNTNYNSLAVNSSGDSISYGIQNGYLYDRTGGYYLKDMPQFFQAYKVIIWVTADRTSIAYTWEGPSSTVQGATGNKFLVNGVEVTTVGGVVNWQVWSYSDSNTSGYNTKSVWYDESTVYNTNGWTNSNYKTLTSSYNLSQHFTGTNWSGFFKTNKNTNTSSTITVPSGALTSMFSNTGGTWTGTPVINKAYFTNAILIPEANMSQTDVGYAEIWWKDTLISSDTAVQYKLPSSTVFDGSSTYIDTNLRPLMTDQDFTVFVDFQQSTLIDGKTVLHCQIESSPYPGLYLDTNSGNLRRGYYGALTSAKNLNRHKALIVHTGGTKNACTWYFDSTTGTAGPATTTYSAVNRSLLIGCYQSGDGTGRGRFWNGTIYDCIVLKRVATSLEISSLMSGNIPSTFDWSVKNQTLSVRFICNGILYDKLRIDSDGSMYYGRDNVFTIVYDVNTNTWDEDAKKIQVLSSISSTFINEWNAFLSQSKLY